MTHLLHNFTALRVGDRRTILILGTGMSSGIAPQPADVTNQIPEAEKRLNIKIVKDRKNLNECGYLYRWAEEACKMLRKRKEPLPKLAMAKALGILEDPAWLGKINVPLQRSRARHRVIARFAREGRLHAIWSLNWDCVLEAGLESVGFEEYDKKITANQPWQSTYVTYITTQGDARPAAIYNNFTVYKPHGCVKALKRAEEETNNGNHDLAETLTEGFLVTSSDLDKLENKFTDQNQKSFCYNLYTQLESHPLIAIGWSASEPYLQTLARKALESHNELGETDELTIVDLTFNNDGHKKLAEYYHSDKSKAFVQIQKDNHDGLTTDRLFLWIQTLYALDCLMSYAQEGDKDGIQDMYTRFSEKPQITDFAIEWVDNFLPAWVRLCWREGLVDYIIDGKPIPRNSIPLNKSDEHVPWKIQGIPRPDLCSASNMLTQLGDNNKNWEFTRYPGGFWDKTRGLLVIPLPEWGKETELLGLKGLKPLIDKLVAEAPMAFIRQLGVLPVHHQSREQIEDGRVSALVRSLAKCMRVSPFAEPNKILVFSLDDL